MPELEVFPIAVLVESRYTLPLPFEVGEYTFNRKRRPYTVHIKEPNSRTGRQHVLVCFQGVSYNPNRLPNFEVDRTKVKEFQEKVVLKKRDLKTYKTFRYKETAFEEIHSDNQIRRTHKIPYEEDVAVYELAIETINELILASKCAAKGLSEVSLFDENYFSALYHRDSWFYNFIPEFSPASRVKKRKMPAAIGLPSRFIFIDKDDFKKEVLPILKHRKDYAIEEMLVSANKAFIDGEYEASLVLFEAVFEAMAKEEIIKHYRGKSFSSEAERKEKLDSVLGKKGIRRLLKEEYPKCQGSKKFDNSVVQYRKWDKIYTWRNEVAHSLQDRERISKKEALRMFNDFRKIFRYLFSIESSYR